MCESHSKVCFEHFYLEQDEVDRYYCTIRDNRQNVVGWCKYYKPSLEYEGVCIEYISINDGFQRNGYGTLTVKELQTKYGKLIWDHRFTNVGRKWFDSLIKKGIVSA